jgi:hypothetical protein
MRVQLLALILRPLRLSRHRRSSLQHNLCRILAMRKVNCLSSHRVA